MEKIEDVHKENLDLIKKHNLVVGQWLRCYTIKSIHPMYGWIVMSDSNLPQRVRDLFKVLEFDLESGVERYDEVKQYKLPEFFISAIINGDYSGIKTEDVPLIEKMYEDFDLMKKEFNFKHYIIPMPKGESYFSQNPDYCKKACYVYDVDVVFVRC